MIRKFQVLTLSFLCVLVLLAAALSQAQITPSQDAFTNSVDPTTNFGANVLLDVDGASQITYIQFNLASIPSGARVTQATLKLFVNAVTTAGSLNVDYVNGTWAESTITHNLAPALGNTIASGVSVSAADKNQYILIDVTAAVEAWLDGSQTNDGIALVANSTFNASFDSKENTTTSHPPELDIVFAGGTINGVKTATGSGLTGGGTSGVLNLSLLKTCADGQVLEWSGSGWACATASGTGTITGVTAGTDLTGGGTSGKVTLNLDITKVPQLNAVNTFTGNQSVIGSLGIGTISPTQALDLGNNNNMVIRVDPGSDTTAANGGYALTGRGAGGVPNTWWTLTAPVGGGFGVPVNSYSIWQYPPNAIPGCCLNRFSILPAEASTDTGGTVTIDQNGNTSQPRTAGGMAKAMAYVNALNAPYSILKCFNSALTGAAASTPPCGINFTEQESGLWNFDLGFEVDDRFVVATLAGTNTIGGEASCIFVGGNGTPNIVQILTSDCGSSFKGGYFYFVVF